MSKFWSTLPKMGDQNEEGIISYKKPFDFEYDNIRVNDKLSVKVRMNQQHQNETVYFILENGLSPSGNSYLVNPKFLNFHLTTTLYEESSNKILGFALALYNTLRMNEEEYKSVHTTLLTVNVDYRKINLAKYLISSIIDHTYSMGSYVGYHFIAAPRTESNIHCHTYFRPLNIKIALNYGYEVPVGEYETRTSSDYSVRQGKFSDLELCNRTKRHLYTSLTETEFSDLMKNCEIATVLCKQKVVGVIIYRPTLLHIFKVKRLCPIARVLYFEMLPKHNHHVVSAVLDYLTKMDKYVVMSGVCLGELNDEKFRRSLGFITSGNTYLDFYNFNIAKQHRNSEAVNVLYV
jgi:hypothetical protein